jgi:homoserine O-acetyltransferase
MAESDCFELGNFALESGAILPATRLAYRTWGRLNERRDNAVVVFHSLTGDADVTTWWSGLFGPGKAVDPEQHYVICANLLGSCYGSTGPTSINPATGKPWQANFPDVTVRDNVRAQRQLCTHLGVDRVDMVIGGSLGGMLALQWAAWDPSVRRVVAVATSAAHSAWCIAWSESQRQAIYADPAWEDGFYAPDRPPAAGLAAARMMAMLSYRNSDSFQQRFGREPAAAVAVTPQVQASDQTGPRPSYSVQSYLHHQGRKLVQRFDANSYVCLTHMANSHDLGLEKLSSDPDRFARPSESGKKRSGLEQPVLLVGIPSDILFPLADIEALAAHLTNAEVATLPSPHGHDGFLLDADRLDVLIRDWSERLDAPANPRHHALKTCIST